MHRPASRVLAFLPVPLLALALLIWLRSFLPEDFYGQAVNGRLLLLFVNGSYTQWLQPDSDHYMGALQVWENLSTPGGSEFEFRFLGVVVAASRSDSFPRHFVLSVPFAWIVLPLVAASAMWFVGRRRRRRWETTGRCSRCGYDLRATTGVCPECGAQAAQDRQPLP